MKDHVVSKIAEVMEENLKEFFAGVEMEYKIPKDALWKKWKEEDKPNTKKDKKSEYQVFFSIQRNKMIKENPNTTFGEISKQVSILWKKLTPQEKLKYTTAPQENVHRLETLRKDYLKLSTQDLKNLCKEKGIHKLRKKDDMVSALVSWEEDQQKGQLSIQQELSKGRSKLELSAEDKEEEEEDFYFHEEEDNGSSNEVLCDDEEDTTLGSSDEDDLFDDDDT